MNHFIPGDLMRLAIQSAEREQAALDAPADPSTDITTALIEVLAAVAFGGPGSAPSASACLLARDDAFALLKARLSAETVRALAHGRSIAPLRDRIGRDLRLSRRPA